MLQGDLYLVSGLVIGVFAIPSIIGALTEGRAPRVAAITVLVAGTLVVLALRENPRGYELSDVPDAVIRVIGAVVN